ncbi:hypothetical protein AHF37_00767 [Paragonimus kellicotti]|nr:hypothetical protein AHF37_00767 [Paragonimus kellicotti]
MRLCFVLPLFYVCLPDGWGELCEADVEELPATPLAANQQTRGAHHYHPQEQEKVCFLYLTTNGWGELCEADVEELPATPLAANQQTRGAHHYHPQEQEKDWYPYTRVVYQPIRRFSGPTCEVILQIKQNDVMEIFPRMALLKI